jgi:hypothetical protein
MRRRLNRIAGALAILVVLVIAGVGAAAGEGMVPFLSSDEDAVLFVPGEQETATQNAVAPILLQYEWVLALIAVLIFMAIAAYGFRRGFDLLSKHSETTMREPWE